MKKLCPTCGKTLSRGSIGRDCRPCRKTRRRKEKFCAGCGVPVCARQNKSGYCRTCLIVRVNSDPTVKERRLLALRVALNRPETRKKLSDNQRRLASDPAVIERWREAARRNYHITVGSPKARARSMAPETIAKRAKSHSERDLGWCPPERRDEYRKLAQRTHGYNAETAKAEMLRRIEADRIGALAATSLSDAISYLRRYAPILIRDNGYLYGTAVLTAEQIIARAELRGWQPERWAA